MIEALHRNCDEAPIVPSLCYEEGKNVVLKFLKLLK